MCCEVCRINILNLLPTSSFSILYFYHFPVITNFSSTCLRFNHNVCGTVYTDIYRINILSLYNDIICYCTVLVSAIFWRPLHRLLRPKKLTWLDAWPATPVPHNCCDAAVKRGSEDDPDTRGMPTTTERREVSAPELVDNIYVKSSIR